jgi:hypothetical protein
MDGKTFILVLKSKLQKPKIFKKWNPIHICTNSYKNCLINFAKIYCCTIHIRSIWLGHVFLNAQQMFAKLTIYLIFSLPLHHTSRSFQFIDNSLEDERDLLSWTFTMYMAKKLLLTIN